MFRFEGEKERQLQSNQFDLVTKYAEMEMRQKQLQQALDHAHQEMFEYKSKQEDAISARSSEIDILNQDLERANEVKKRIYFNYVFFCTSENFIACIEC